MEKKIVNRPDYINDLSSKRIAYYTLGCKLNQFETFGIENLLSSKGYKTVSFSYKADFFIINTCAVTNKSNFHARQIIRRAKSVNPSAYIIVIGCYPQVNPADLRKMKGIDLLLGNNEKNDILYYLKRLSGDGAPLEAITDISDIKSFNQIPIDRFPNHTRAFIKIQEGCNQFCTFCIVPFARGNNRSAHPDQILNQMKRLIDNGYQEIVLTGIHLGTYGQDLSPQLSLTSLLRQICSIKGLKRVRLSSIEPIEFTEELIELITYSAIICPHLHIPLQSGDNFILKKMGRIYDKDYYRNLIYKLLKLRPDMAIGADVIVGFPYEGEQEFQNTYE